MISKWENAKQSLVDELKIVKDLEYDQQLLKNPKAMKKQENVPLRKNADDRPLKNPY